MRYNFLQLAALTLFSIVAIIWAPEGAGQSSIPEPTAAQMEMLNRLPPSQRQAILREIRNAQRQSGQAQPLEYPELLRPPLDGEPAADSDEEAAEEVERISGGDTLVIEFELSEKAAPDRSIDEEDAEQRREFLARLNATNPYDLDRSGFLYLPGVPAIALAGLDAAQAEIRLRAEESLAEFDAFVTVLPLEPTGVAALEPFGYDLFEDVPTTFAPATDIPVPADYVLGPGDVVKVQLFGNENADYDLVVQRDGTLNFPEIGPVTLAGLTFEQARQELQNRVGEQMIGVRAAIGLGELRSIRIFVLGDVARPGSYTVSGLSTMINALFASGGVKTIGSLRDIQLKRNGGVVSRMDLYDLLIRGDTRGDRRLRPGDVIFVPPVGDTVAVAGEVKRPAIYELRGEASVAQIVELAGGLRAGADPGAVKLERRLPSGGTQVTDVDLDGRGTARVGNGDVIRVPAAVQQLENSVQLSGNVFQPGLYQWREGMRLADLITSTNAVKPRSDLGYVLIRREVEANALVDVLSADLRRAWAAPASEANVGLRPRDTVIVFSQEIGRRHVVDPLLAELRLQAAQSQAVNLLRIGGQVRAPGEYPLESGMRVTDALRAGGGLTESAYTIDAELTRYEIVNGEYRETALVTLDLAAALRGDATADILLRPYDYISIKEVPRWREQQTVEIRGEVMFPGVYPITQGETLSSVLQRAGGLTDLAFPAGSVFVREELKDREREQVQTLADRVESDLAALSLSDPNNTEAISIGQSLITQLRDAEPTGRLVIDLQSVLSEGKGRDIVLKNKDTLLVPNETQEVTVLGEVQYATSHIFSDGLSRADYLARSGGLTQKADRKRIYVVRANGEVVANSGSRWFGRGRGVVISPGDTIVVPVDTDRVKPLVLWQSATQILYNLAIAAAAVNSF